MFDFVTALVVLIASCVPLVILCRLMWHIGTWFKVRSRDSYGYYQDQDQDEQQG